MHVVDLNCDLGEGAAHDEALMTLITSANIACGGHAGDEKTMRRTLGLAQRFGVAAGAHPGYADRANFGRKELGLTASEIEIQVTQQIRTLQTLASEGGVALTHVKAHGALYHRAAEDEGVASALIRAMRTVRADLALYAPAKSMLAEYGRAAGFRVAEEVFADRGYDIEGRLIPRGELGAILSDPAIAAAQAVRLVTEDGRQVDTVCLHGDGLAPLEFARRVRDVLLRNGIALRRFE